MRFPAFLLGALLGAAPLLPLAAQGGPAPTADGRLLRPGVDTLVIYFIQGTDTVRSGLLVDELRVVDRAQGSLLQRVYHSVDQRLGTRRDTIVDVLETLAPVRYRSRASRSQEHLDFQPGAVTGWARATGGDSIPVRMTLPDAVYNSASFDLVIRSAPLQEGWTATIPVLLGSRRELSTVPARVVGASMLGGRPTWRVEAEIVGLAVTFWIDQETRALRRQRIQLGPDMAFLFARPRRQ